MKILFLAFCAAIFFGASASPAMADCSGLKGGKFADTEITKAEAVARGAFAPADHSGMPAAIFHSLPAFCRVVGVIRPTADSEIGFELWMPDEWNGRFLQVGNGGFAGLINYGGLVPGLKNGFAVASTDDGHSGSGAAWALGHPEKMIDFGYRAVHLTSVISKEIVGAYYSRRSSHAYFSGCSDGGRESLMEAQRFPDDFDGWVVGAPANDFTGVMAYFLNLTQIAGGMKEPLAPAQIENISKTELAQCDAKDGVVDGVIGDPRQCRFDPEELACKGASDGKCLSRNQVEAVRKIYDDAIDSKTHTRLTPGFQGARGGEVAQWPLWIGPPTKESGLKTSLSQMFTDNFFPFMVYGDAKLDAEKLDLLQAYKDGRSRTGAIINAMDPDLSAVRASGKKIIQYHGWGDGVIFGEFSVEYYEAVEKYLQQDNRDFYRLFMAPGMEHCGGGPGPNAFGTPYDPRPFGAGYDSSREFDPEHHVIAALVEWVEKGTAPERIVATKFQDDDSGKAVVRTRPLCVYPKVARFTGKGSSDDAKNFVCAAPAPDVEKGNASR